MTSQVCLEGCDCGQRIRRCRVEEKKPPPLRESFKLRFKPHRMGDFWLTPTSVLGHANNREIEHMVVLPRALTRVDTCTLKHSRIWNQSLSPPSICWDQKKNTPRSEFTRRCNTYKINVAIRGVLFTYVVTRSHFANYRCTIGEPWCDLTFSIYFGRRTVFETPQSGWTSVVACRVWELNCGIRDMAALESRETKSQFHI